MRNVRSVKRLWAERYEAGRPQELENEMAPFRRVSILRQLQLSTESKQFIKRMREHIFAGPEVPQLRYISSSSTRGLFRAAASIRYLRSFLENSGRERLEAPPRGLSHARWFGVTGIALDEPVYPSGQGELVFGQFSVQL